MTKLRPPLSTEQALDRIAGQLPAGVESMAEVTDRSVGLIRAWRDPDRREKVPFDDAIVLDLAFQAAGGIGAPLHEAYSVQLELAECSRFADRHLLLERTADLIREGGQAHAALVKACQPSASASDLDLAFRELGDAFEEMKPVFALLKAAIATTRGDATVPAEGDQKAAVAAPHAQSP